MKIFLSYGHNDHTKLVDMVFNALREEGHKPWKDNRYEGESGIPAGEDFTKLIYSTIDESDFVIAFVSEITKDRPYCCDERQYAYNHKDTHYIQIRLDNTDITLGNSRSYVDMSEVEMLNGEINIGLFNEGMRAIFSAMRDPESFSQGGLIPWAKFEVHLKVHGARRYEEFTELPPNDDYVGREWLTEKCKKWACDSSEPCRLFVIYGEAGSGKTAFVQHLSTDRELVHSVHVCVYDRPSTRSAKNTLKDLAFVLAKNNDRYYERLKSKNFSKIDELTEDGLFEVLFIEPLKDETEKYLIIIDALDELDKDNGFEPLIKIFRQYIPQMNPNISFLVTGRPDENIREKLRTVSLKKLPQVYLDKNTNHDDLKAFIYNKLNAIGIYSDTLSAKILEACDGNFEYLSLLFKEVIEEGLELTENISLPKGLYNRYTQYLDRKLENQDYRFNEEQYLLLSVICTAYENMPVSLLAKLTGFKERYAERELLKMGSLIRHVKNADGEIYISLFAKGFRDYLISGEVRKYSVDIEEGIHCIAEFVLENCPTEKKLAKYPYLCKYGYTYLLLYYEEEPDRVQDYISAQVTQNHDKAFNHLADALCDGGETAINAYFGMKNTIDKRGDDVVSVLENRREKTVLKQIAYKYKETGDEADYYWLLAVVEMFEPSPQAYEKAEKLYKKAMELAEKNFQENPCYDSRRSLSASYNNLALLLKNQQTEETLKEAEKLYRKSIELLEKNFQENPCYDSRRELSASYCNLADMLSKQRTEETLKEAEKLYRKSIALLEQNCQENPCYDSRSSLSISYSNYGLLLLKNEQYLLAEECFVKSAELCEMLLKNFKNSETKTALINTYKILIAIAQKQDTPEYEQKAEKWIERFFDLLMEE